MCSEPEGKMHGGAWVLDSARPWRTAGGIPHGGEDAEGEEGKRNVSEMRGLTRDE